MKIYMVSLLHRATINKGPKANYKWNDLTVYAIPPRSDLWLRQLNFLYASNPGLIRDPSPQVFSPAILYTREAQLSQTDRATRYVCWNLVTCCIAAWKIPLEKICNRRVTVKVAQRHQNGLYDRSYITSLSQCVVTPYIAPLPRYYHSVYVTACDLEKSLSLKFTVAYRFMYKIL